MTAKCQHCTKGLYTHDKGKVKVKMSRCLTKYHAMKMYPVLN